MYSYKELWRENYASSIIQSRPYLRIFNFANFGWDRSKARALLFWYTVALKFKTLYCTMYGEEHVQQCSFYHTKWNMKWMDDQDIAK